MTNEQLLVPSEPTEAMLRAGAAELYTTSGGDFDATGEEIADTYKAMIGAARAALAAPPAGISPAPLAGTLDGWEVIGWEYRWLDTANKPNRWSAWERCRARNIHMNTDKDFADEIQAYIDMGNPYELRTLYARAALSQGDVSGEGEGS